MLKKIIFSAILVCFSCLAIAGNETTGSTKIKRVENWTAGSGLYIKTNQSSLNNPAGCSITDKYHMADGASEISKSMILTAYVAGKNVNFTIVGTQCSSNRPQIVQVVLE